MKHIAILGSTGSIGISALKVIRRFPGEFKVVSLTTNSNVRLLSRQIKEYHPKLACVNDSLSADRLTKRVKTGVKIAFGQDGLVLVVRDKLTDTVLLAISGSAALSPLLNAIEAKKTVALANKEALVMAGSIIMKRAKDNNVLIIPIDSEQSAIWQCINGEDKSRIKNIYLTASGGPFRNLSQEKLKNVSVSKVLDHPRWKMGKKITVDSASLMNKGLEVIEAAHLFAISPSKIKVIIHPEAIIHSMVEFVDGVVMAQLSVTDMRIPIQYALSFPERLANGMKGINFVSLKSLNFEGPDFKKFPCLNLAYQAAEGAGTLPCVLNAANEVSVNEFLKGKIKFTDIPEVIEAVMLRHKYKKNPDLDEIKEADSWATKEANKIIRES
ncbi:MAG: 1-deoxy-D-xylulose-5-phosphate reductoisomerase [Candidatus Omnitrophota bacterium]